MQMYQRDLIQSFFVTTERSFYLKFILVSFFLMLKPSYLCAFFDVCFCVDVDHMLISQLFAYDMSSIGAYTPATIQANAKY